MKCRMIRTLRCSPQRRRAPRRGVALVLVLVTVALAVVLGFGYVSSATIRALAVNNATQATRAHYLAEAGIQHALQVLWETPSVIDGSSFSNRRGPYQVDGSDDSYTFWGRQDDANGLYTLFCQATRGAISQAVALQVFRSPPYDEQMLDKAPEGYWRLGEQSGNVVQDSSGNGYDLTAYGDIGWGQPGAIAADADTGAYFDGANDYMYRPPTAALKIDGDLTVSLWFQVSEMPATSGYLLTYSDPGEKPEDNASYQAVLNSDGSITFLMEYGSGKDLIHTFSGLGIGLDEWHNIAVTRTQSTRVLTVYVDGQSKGSWVYGSPGPPKANAGKDAGLWVGSAYGTDGFFKGYMDELAILDHPLTPGELSALHAAGVTDEVMQIRGWDDAPSDLGGG